MSPHYMQNILPNVIYPFFILYFNYTQIHIFTNRLIT